MNEDHILPIILTSCLILFGFGGIIFREPIAYSLARGEFLVASEQYDDFVAPYLVNCTSLQNEEQVQCVVSALRPIVKYNGSEDASRILSPKEYVAHGGGTCKEIAIIYVSSFRQLNWTRVDFRSPVPKHVSITIANALGNESWVYCDVEMNQAKCIEVRNSKW
jgi:hypothetical protein